MKNIFLLLPLAFFLSACVADPCQKTVNDEPGLDLAFGLKSGQSVKEASLLAFGKNKNEDKTCGDAPIVEIKEHINHGKFSGDVKLTFFGTHGLVGVWIWPDDPHADPNKIFALPSAIAFGENKEIEGYEISWGKVNDSTVFTITDERRTNKMREWVTRKH